MEIAGRTFLVTGGKSGLGEATAARLERAGATVEILDLPETDVTDEAAVRQRVAACAELHGVVNCAGHRRRRPRDQVRPRRLPASVIEVNLIGTFNVIRLAAERIAAE